MYGIEHGVKRYGYSNSVGVWKKRESGRTIWFFRTDGWAEIGKDDTNLEKLEELGYIDRTPQV